MIKTCNTKIFFEINIKALIFVVFFLLINKSKVIKIDNMFNEPLYQDNINFSDFDIKCKILAIYYHENKFNKSLIENQAKLAKEHGIYGFGIVYNILIGFKLNEDLLNFFAYENELNFGYFIILNYNLNYTLQKKNSLIENLTTDNKIDKNILIESIEKYFMTDKYIRFKGKPILGFFNSFNIMTDFINYIRKYIIENKKENIFIISISYENSNIKYSNNSDIINSIIEYPSHYKYLKNNLDKNYFYNFYYYYLFRNQTIKSKNIKNFIIYNGCNPEKFFIIFKKYINLSNPDKNTILLFNAWNNHEENSYLEPNEELGYSYLNYFSKAIFNIRNEIIYNFEGLENKCKIAIQVHLFYEELIMDIINKTNNIPVKFDLFISIISSEIYFNLEKIIKKYSRANHYEILIVENKGRDILPFLKQIGNRFKQYKYLCHLHTKKSKHSKVPNLGVYWRNYLYNNLLGNVEIVSEILSDFENKEKLGFIFPETYYKIIQPFYNLTNVTNIWIHFIGLKLFPNHKIGKLLNYPAGNMFWAKIKAIFQIFKYDFNEYFPNEKNQTSETIMHGIERIWLYLVKYNGFYYKTIFKLF